MLFKSILISLLSLVPYTIASDTQHNNVAHLWSDHADLLPHTHNENIDLQSIITQATQPIETIIVLSLPQTTYSTINNVDVHSDNSEATTTLHHSYIKHYLLNSKSHASTNNIDLTSLLNIKSLNNDNIKAGNAFELTCSHHNDLKDVNPNAYAFNNKLDVLYVKVTNEYASQSCIQNLLNKSGSKYIAMIYAENSMNSNEQQQYRTTSTNRKLLQSAIATQYSDAVNPQYPWSSTYQSDIPLINRPGPLYISSSILFGLMIGAFLILVLYIGVNTLGSIERPVRFATQPLNIGKEY